MPCSRRSSPREGAQQSAESEGGRAARAHFSWIGGASEPGIEHTTVVRVVERRATVDVLALVPPLE